MGTLQLTSICDARATSVSYPRSMSSTPETLFQIFCAKSAPGARYTSRAAWASGENEPLNSLIIAPAPSQSSRLGRRLLSSQRSPAGITDIRFPNRSAASATAEAFRRQPASVIVSPVARLSEAPFGEGSTIRVPEGMSRNDAGDREKRPAPRATANSASTAVANSRARSSFH